VDIWCQWFLFASQPAVMGKALGIIYRAIATHISKKAGYTKTAAHTGAVTLIQRFGGAINLNVHFHMLFLDGVYVDNEHESAARSKMTAPGKLLPLSCQINLSSISETRQAKCRLLHFK
jgi:hypothetical protein